MIVRPPAPCESWTVEQWETYRARTAAVLAVDPGWVAGPQVLAMCDYRIARLVDQEQKK